MTLENLNTLTAGATDNFADLVATVSALRTTDPATGYLKQYDVSGHAVMDVKNRPDKQVLNDAGEIQKLVPLNKIALPLQEIIASRAAAFLAANPIIRNSTPTGDEERMVQALDKVWDNNKLDFDTLDLAEKWMSETEVAELWYSEPAKPDDAYWGDTLKGAFTLRVRILAKSNGDTLHPVFDNTGNMIAFGREWIAKVDGKDEKHFDFYTDAFTYLGTQTGTGWSVKTEKSFAGKIPVIYYQYPTKKPVWNPVQTSIDRLETKISNHADTNDYFDSPILLLIGNVLGELMDKKSSGKAFQIDPGGDAKYLEWNSAPESTRLEIENLLRFIYSLTDTPDISFENLKGLGTTSGFALEMMFMGAHLKAAKHAGPFGKGIQRRINFLKAAIALIDRSLEKAASVSIKPSFEFFVPKDVQGLITMLNSAVSGGILSKKTVMNNLKPLVQNVDDEEKQIEKEKEAAAKAMKLPANKEDEGPEAGAGELIAV